MRRSRRVRSSESTKSADSSLPNIAENIKRADNLDVYIDLLMNYGIDLRNRIIQVTSDIDYPLFDFVDNALTLMETNGRKGVTIKINSFGGSVYEALAIVGRIKQSYLHITTIGYGAIMSAATLILSCGSKRKMSSLGFFMTHESSYSLDGRHSSNKNYVRQVDIEEKTWANAMAKFTKKDYKFWLKTGRYIDAYFDAEKCLELGIVDEIF